jgi:exodeoxyribonuclease V gamma subunit
LFSLPFGQFRRRELLQLITHPNVVARFPGLDASQWMQWCQELHIVHGADHDDHAGTYIEADVLNWQQGMRRLVLGAFMTDAERLEKPEPFCVGPAAYLPLEHAQTDIHASARLNLLVQSLVADARFLKRETLSLRQWAEIMAEMIRVYLGAVDGADGFDLMKCHEILGSLADADLSESGMSFRTAWEFARGALAALDAKRGQYLADGVVISSFLPMRPIPFRVVFITGMGEGKFPATERVNPLDLRQVGWREGDVRHREQEKYMFLETLISTRERLYLSWVSRDGRTGEPLQASSVVRELRHILEGFEGPAGLAARTLEPPLRRHEAPGLLAGDQGSPLGLHREAFEEARVKALREDLVRVCAESGATVPAFEDLRREPDGDLFGALKAPLRLSMVKPVSATSTGRASTPVETKQLEAKQRRSLSIWHLRRFLECPLQASASIRVGLGEWDEEDPYALENEAFETSGMVRSRVLREVFESTLGDSFDGDALGAAYRNRVRLLELRGLVPTGLFKEAEQARHLSTLTTWRGNFDCHGLDLAAVMGVVRFGRASSLDKGEAVLPPVAVEVGLADGQTVVVEIVGRTQLLASGQRVSVNLIGRNALKTRDYLAGFLDHVLLAAAKDSTVFCDEPWQVFVNPGRDLHGSKREAQKSMAVLAPMSREEARAYLTHLLEDMLGSVHDYLLPIEAVAQFVQNDCRHMAYAVEEALAGREPASSQYGPVRRIEDYGPLGDERARAIVARRFSPLLPILGGL